MRATAGLITPPLLWEDTINRPPLHFTFIVKDCTLPDKECNEIAKRHGEAMIKEIGDRMLRAGEEHTYDEAFAAGKKHERARIVKYLREYAARAWLNNKYGAPQHEILMDAALALETAPKDPNTI